MLQELPGASELPQVVDTSTSPELVIARVGKTALPVFVSVRIMLEDWLPTAVTGKLKGRVSTDMTAKFEGTLQQDPCKLMVEVPALEEVIVSVPDAASPGWCGR